ncbi:ATP-binding protein [Nakamurella lactea]|uniref:ATP-binding protein n=1 Tax=Nakamurella lactea TaxID=459515 RepID=UPI00137736D7|nr:ATP-binding protein [Nakamurella lactea]
MESTSPAEALAAQLAGADVVLPCIAETVPDEAVLTAAGAAARALAEKARLTREQTRAAAHEVAGNASAVAMMAHLLSPSDPARADHLRRLAARGTELAWQAGRLTRSNGASLELADLAEVVGGTCRSLRTQGRVELRMDCGARIPVLVDRHRLARAVSALIANSRRSGARVVTVRVAEEPPGWAALTIVDDGCGLPDGWAAGDPLRPFVSGWNPPGDGLGLAEAAEYAADHGGSLHVEPRGDATGVRAVLRIPVIGGPATAGGSAADVSTADGAADRDPDWTLASILEGIARRDPLPQSLEALVATMERHLPASVCSILLLDQETGTLRHGAGARLPPPYRAAIDGLPIGPLAGSCGTAAFTREEVVSADIATDERWIDYRHFALTYGLRSCWSRPILDVDRGIVLGTFAVYHRAPWVPGPSATELVQRLTHVAAVAIGTAALHGQLVESEARFRSTFEAAGLGIALVSPSGTIQDANAALVGMAGRPLVGTSIAGLLVEQDAAATLAALTSTLARPDGDQSLTTAEVRVRRAGPDTESVWAAISGSLIRGPAGEPRHFCIELFDLTERRQVGQARLEQEVAEAADRAKSELLALVSHEVRTPLHAVIGFAQALQSLPLSPERQREGIEHILGAGRHLLQLINDLLDVTGAETGQLQLVPESVAPQEVVAEAMEIVAGLAAERSIVLRTQAVSGLPPVRADRHRLRQVLLNLLGNGIKFTPVGGAVAVVVGPNEFLVQDSGRGIPTDLLPFLFTPFHRGDDTAAAGSGLGLAVSRRLMRAMDGDLTLVDSSDRGTTFRLVLPSAPSPAAPRASGTISQEPRVTASTQ